MHRTRELGIPDTGNNRCSLIGARGSPATGVQMGSPVRKQGAHKPSVSSFGIFLKFLPLKANGDGKREPRISLSCCPDVESWRYRLPLFSGIDRPNHCANETSEQSP